MKTTQTIRRKTPDQLLSENITLQERNDTLARALLDRDAANAVLRAEIASLHEEILQLSLKLAKARGQDGRTQPE